MLKYFTGSMIATVSGLLAAVGIGYYYEPTGAAAAQAFFIALILAILEVSLSFDNAIVNAVVLGKMTPEWRHRFLTWGMLIAVFGMRLLFPLLIVAIVAGINPWEALVLASTAPADYAKLMLSAHADVSAFGGAFLLMVALKYFYDEDKEEHWIRFIEVPLKAFGKVEAVEIAITLVALIWIDHALGPAERNAFLVSGLAGVITYVIVDGLGGYLEHMGAARADIQKASVGLFIYLEVLDASFSFDGVVGAFAITNNLFIIMIGLSIGAFFVRSLTILFVEKEMLQKFAYLEQGAFYAIATLAVLMLLDPLLHVPEWITGLTGAVFIVAAFVSSLRAGVREAKA